MANMAYDAVHDFNSSGGGGGDPLGAVCMMTIIVIVGGLFLYGKWLDRK